MTDLINAAKMALEALEHLQGGCTDSEDGTVEALTVWCPEVVDALRNALAEAEKAEPVRYAVRFNRPGLGEDVLYATDMAQIERSVDKKLIISIQPLFAHPPATTQEAVNVVRLKR